MIEEGIRDLSTRERAQADALEEAREYRSFKERRALELMRVDCETCAIGATPRERLVPFHVQHDGVTRAGWCCPCQVRRRREDNR